MSAGFAKLLDKAFIIGFVLPAVLFLTAAFGIFGCPDVLCPSATDKSANPFAELTYAALLTYLFAILLTAFNFELYRFFEGYLPPASWSWVHRNREKKRFAALKKQLDAMPNDDPSRIELASSLQLNYPSKETDVLPTSFGNRIRAFELYPVDSYGIDAISAWPRLLSVVSKDYGTLIDDARSYVDFGMNVASLSLALAVVAVVELGLSLMPANGLGRFAAAPHFGNGWLPIAIACAVVFVLAYQLAASAIYGWGASVSAAFDCYLPALAKQLGYDLPSSDADRRKIWTDVSRHWLYGDSFTPPYAANDKPAKHKKSDPSTKTVPAGDAE